MCSFPPLVFHRKDQENLEGLEIGERSRVASLISDGRNSLVWEEAWRGREKRGARTEPRGLPILPPPNCPAPCTQAPPLSAAPPPPREATSRSFPSWGRGASRRRGSRLPRAPASAWRGRSLCHPGRGRSRRRCREAELPLFQSPEPGNTRDTRRRRSGTTPACCRPATSPRGDAQGRARGAHPGRARQLGEPRGAAGEGRGRPHHPCLLTASTSNFLKPGSDAAHPSFG